MKPHSRACTPARRAHGGNDGVGKFFRLFPTAALLGSNPGIDVPERHAEQIVGQMAKWLARERARLSGELVATLDRSKSRFGSPISPIAQRRLANRLRKAGDKAILDLRIRT